jgi:hypothetical protein
MQRAGGQPQEEGRGNRQVASRIGSDCIYTLIRVIQRTTKLLVRIDIPVTSFIGPKQETFARRNERPSLD